MTPIFTKSQQIISVGVLCSIFLLVYLIYLTSIQNHIDLSLGDFKVDAIYQRAIQLDDGSVELILNIPNAEKVISSIAKSEQFELIKSTTASDIKQPLPQTKKTLYPLTVNSPYVINSPNICTNVSNLAFLTIVHTATGHFERRRLIRETWANKDLFKDINSRIVFVFGLTPDKNIQTLLENEQVVYGDIVQGDFLDTYHNLTHKGVLAFRWVSEHCNHSKMVVKIDDDIFLNPFLLVESVIPKYSKKKRFMLCHLRNKGTSGIMREPKTKWHVDNDQFKGYKSYPVTYCNGYFVLISPEIISPMYRAASFTPFFWVDDVYLYGLLASKIGHVVYEDIRRNLTLSDKTGINCYSGKKPCGILGVNAWQSGSVEKLWAFTLKNLTKEQKLLVNDRFILS